MHAVPRLRDRHPGLRVVIAGDGPYRAELEEQARRLALGSTVRFTGFLDATQLPAVLGATDATVVPSLYEPFGMVALEAAAAGAPLAVARTGGLAEIVEPGVTGVTFPHSDPAALAGAVGQLLGDEVFARRVARRARTMVGERYGWATIAARTAASYTAPVVSTARYRPAAPPPDWPVDVPGSPFRRAICWRRPTTPPADPKRTTYR
ncbi:hypothetical protein GCM10027614_22380 [Micromonospora vulcania]